MIIKKKITLLIIGLVIGIVGSMGYYSMKLNMEKQAPSVAKAVIKIEKMTCEDCARKIALKLNSTQGIEMCMVSYPQSQAVCEYNDKKISLATMRQLINELGFETPFEESSNKLQIMNMDIQFNNR